MDALARYRIRDRVARSRWSALYSADDKISGSKVVIKVFQLRGSVANAVGTEDEAHWLKRFELEAQIMAAIDHQHVIPLIERGTLSDGRPCLLMPYVAANLAYEIGPDVKSPAMMSRLPPPRRPKPMKTYRAIQILRQVLSGLSALHDQGIVHRDLKPANILLTKRTRGDVLLCDFGMAKWGTKIFDVDGEVIGSRGYISPEQSAAPADVGVQSDMYAFGRIAFRMLCGRLPIEGERSIKDTGINTGENLERLIYDCLDPRSKKRPLNASVAEARLQGRE